MLWLVLPIALASSVPALNPGVLCMSRSEAAPPEDQSGVYVGCLRRQMAAQAEIRRRWANYPEGARRVCLKPAAASHGYVAMLACLEKGGRD